MKSRPIIFSSEMVRAILDGRKTQTRRVIKLRDGSLPQDEEMSMDENNNVLTVMDFSKDWPQWQELKCPYGIPGDKLWVRETFFYEWPTEDPPEDYRECRIVYRETEPDYIDGDMREYLAYRWSPSVHMPKWASRITLEIKDVRVERVQDIKPIDAVREGCPAYLKFEGDVRGPVGLKTVETRSPREQFERLWNSINAKRGYGWDTNPWVWVLEFEVSP